MLFCYVTLEKSCISDITFQELHIFTSLNYILILSNIILCKKDMMFDPLSIKKHVNTCFPKLYIIINIIDYPLHNVKFVSYNSHLPFYDSSLISCLTRFVSCSVSLQIALTNTAFINNSSE